MGTLTVLLPAALLASAPEPHLSTPIPLLSHPPSLGQDILGLL